MKITKLNFFLIGIIALCVFTLLFALIDPFARVPGQQRSCIGSLWQIKTAKIQWALENQKDSNAVPTSAELAVYCKSNTFPVCPQGGRYIIGRLDEEPKCSIGGLSHTLPPQ